TLGASAAEVLAVIAGVDVISGLAVTDRLTGGLGNDTFVFAPGFGNDTITDFSRAVGNRDIIDLSAFHFASGTDALSHAVANGADTVFNFGNGDTLTVQNTAAGNITNLLVDDLKLSSVTPTVTQVPTSPTSGEVTTNQTVTISIANNSLLVSPNGSVSLGISLAQEPAPDDTISVTISFPSSGAHDPTIAAGDHATGNPHTSGGITTYTFSVADVNSGLTFTNHGDPVDTLTVQEILNGDIIATSQTIMVTDPPASGDGTIVSDQPASATGEDTPVQSTSANNHVIVGSPLTEMLSGNSDSPPFLFKTNLDHITDPEINFAQNNANNLLHLPAQLDDTGVHTVTDGAHRSDPHFDVTQLATFKFAGDGSTHPTHAIGTSVQPTPADDDHHDPEINFASNAKNHLLQQADDDGAMIDGAHPAHPHSDVTQLANFKFADDGSAHPGTVVPHDSHILTALLSDSSGTHGPAAPDLAKTFNVPGTVMSDAASDKFIFAENVGHDMVVGHEPDMTKLDHTVPADIQHLL